MNREIKFRAWDTQERVMFAPTDLFLCSDDRTWAIDNDGRYGKPHHQNAEQVVLMQFIGLFDKTGQEIYEGDIVESLVNGKIERGSVEWDSVRSAFYIRFPSDDLYFPSGPKPERLNVIGNKYEQPDLL